MKLETTRLFAKWLTYIVPGYLVAITSTCTIKLEHFEEIGTCGKRNFENKFLDTVFQFLEEIIIY